MPEKCGASNASQHEPDISTETDRAQKCFKQEQNLSSAAHTSNFSLYNGLRVFSQDYPACAVDTCITRYRTHVSLLAHDACVMLLETMG